MEEKKIRRAMISIEGDLMNYRRLLADLDRSVGGSADDERFARDFMRELWTKRVQQLETQRTMLSEVLRDRRQFEAIHAESRETEKACAAKLTAAEAELKQARESLEMLCEISLRLDDNWK